MKRSFLFAAVAAAALLLPTLFLAACSSGGSKAAATESAPEPAALGQIARLSRSGDVMLASQPKPGDFEIARDFGVKTVINIRPEREMAGFDEKARVEALGMRYEQPAFGSPEELTDEVLDENRRLLREAPRPILLHCSSANRVGAVWLAHRVIDDGVDYETALAEAQAVGLRSEAYERVVKGYIERR